MDEPSNEGPSGLHRMIIDIANLEIYGFPIGIVIIIVIWFGLFFGFLRLLEKLGIKISWDGDHSVGG